MIQLYIENSQGSRYAVRPGWICQTGPSRKIDAAELLRMFDTNTLQLVYDQYLGLYTTFAPDIDPEQERPPSQSRLSNAPGYLNERDKAIYLALTQDQLIIEEAPLPYSALGDLQTELVAKIRMGLQQIITQEVADKAFICQQTDWSWVKRVTTVKKKVKETDSSVWRLSIWSKSAVDVEKIVSPARQSFEFSSAAINYVLYEETPEEEADECVTSLYRGVIDVLGFNPSSVSKKQLRLSFNIAEVIYSDPTLRGAVFHFAQDYIKTQHSLQHTNLTASGTFEIILTIALAALTEGDVAITSLTKNKRLVNAFRNIGDLMFDFARTKKQRKILAKNSGYPTVGKSTAVSGKKTPKIAAPRKNSRNLVQVKVGNELRENKRGREQAFTVPHDVKSEFYKINCVRDYSYDTDNYISEVGENYNSDICQSDNVTGEVTRSVNLKTGEVQFTLEDLVLEGALPLSVTRTYRSSNSRNFGLGCGWTHTFSERLVWRPGKPILFFDSEGRIISLPAPGNSSRSHNIYERLTLTRVNDEHWIITTYGISNGAQRHFKATGETGALKLAEIRDDNDNFYLFNYSGEYLRSVESSSGEILYISSLDESPESHLINTLTKENNSGSSEVVAQYVFDSENNLTEAVDSVGNNEKYVYHKGLIKQRTLKTGYSFYFQWDAEGSSAHCIRQWGDPIGEKAAYSYQFIWEESGHGATMCDTRGGRQRFHFNNRGLLTFHQDAEGGETWYEYSDLGHVTKVRLPSTDGTIREELFRYDNQGRLTEKIDVAGNNYQIEYNNEGLATKYTDPSDSSWQYSYNKKRQLVLAEDPLGNQVKYDYTSAGMINSISDSLGNVTSYLWGSSNKLLRISCPFGRSIDCRYDVDIRTELLTPAETKEASCKNEDQGRINVKVAQKDTDIQCRFNQHGLVSEILDKDGNYTRYSYNALHQIKSKTSSSGSQLEYHYDGEGNLICLINEKGECYRLKYDLNNRLIEEEDFYGRVTHYAYNVAGHLINSTEVIASQSGIGTDIYFERDLLGQLIKETTLEGVNSFRYNCLGQLIEAKNNYCSLKWEYDASGRIVAEWQDDSKLSYKYDILGNLTATSLSRKEDVKFIFDHSVESENSPFSSVNGNFNSLLIKTTEGLKPLDNYDPQVYVQGFIVSKFERPIDTVTNILNLLPNSSCSLARVNHSGKVNKNIFNVHNFCKSDSDQLLAFLIYDPADSLLGKLNSTSKVDSQIPGKEVIENRIVDNGNISRGYTSSTGRVEEVGGEGAQRIRYHYNCQQKLIKIENLKVEKGVEKFQDVIRYQYDPLGRCVRKENYDGCVRFFWSGDTLIQQLKNDDQSK
ncbi:DUF6531 domain-containing protein [Microbulbifer sp. ANSA005]|uniref:DUF6531 domain-containing protein n=1 Tax=Microbulbifer sp. ANSA005 TaxID=3243362 RepID=UPI0040424365